MGVLAALLLAASEFATLYRVSVGTTVRQSILGHDQHAYALVLVAAVAVLLLVAAARGSEPAALATAALGVLAVIVGPISDRHTVSSTGVLGRLYDNATAQSGVGYRLELVASVALLLAGAALLAAAPPGLLGRLSGRTAVRSPAP